MFFSFFLVGEGSGGEGLVECDDMDVLTSGVDTTTWLRIRSWKIQALLCSLDGWIFGRVDWKGRMMVSVFVLYYILGEAGRMWM